MKFVLAPDKFKNSLTGFEFCEAVARGILKAIPGAIIEWCPLADGGDGTLDVINYYLSAEKINIQVSDPFFKKMEACYLYNAENKIAYIEMAEASGLKVLGNRNPNCMKSTSLGTGELIKHAIESGAKEIIMGIGGSACNDAGMGIAQALGYEFVSETGEKLRPIGENLILVSDILTNKVIHGLSEVCFKIACDVDNPFYGQRGAAWVYAPQKGATNEEVALLDKGLIKFASLLEKKFKVNVQQIPGSGAAGGIGGGAICFLNAHLTPGIEMIMRLARFADRIKDADYIITGEGLLDPQTLEGKTIKGIIEFTKNNDIPVIALCGSTMLNEEELLNMGLTSVFSITKGITDLNEAMKNASNNLSFTAFNLARLLNVKKTPIIKITGVS